MAQTDSVHGSQEEFDYLRVEVRTRRGTQVFAHSLFRPSGTVRTIRTQRVPGIYNRKQSCGQRNLLLLQAGRIPTAVPPLVVTVGDLHGGTQKGHRPEHLV